MDDRGAVPLTNDNVSRLAGAPKANISPGTQSRRRTRVPSIPGLTGPKRSLQT